MNSSDESLRILAETVRLTGRREDFSAFKYKSTYPVLGLLGEAGELAGEVKKIQRNDGGHLLPDRKLRIMDEMGDVLWYAQAVAFAYGFDLATVIEMNAQKLHDRLANNTIKER